MCENIENLKNMECLNGNDLLTPNYNEIGHEHFNQAYPDERIADYFHNSVILVTGGTGFVGKALLEKLLRSCPGIDTIYVLMRPKRGLSVDQRYKELLKNQVFDRIRARWPERLSKLYPITGDVSAPNLGVSVEQQLLLKKCNTIFHSAATVKFTEPLHAATTLNVQGTATLLKLAGDMPLLKALVHVSTAYSNAPRSYIEERVYPPPYDPECIIKCAKMLPAETVDIIAESLMGEHPNPYTLTKSLAESIVYSHTELPVCIIRPSIVTAAFQEPFPGWIDNVYGVTGIIMEISRGTYRSGYCRERYVVDLVPVDMVVNSCILAAWRQGSKKPGHCPVYNVTSGSINPLQWGHFTQLCVKWARENPTKYVMWYPNFAFTESRFINTFWEISCHFLPAFLYDLLLRAQGRKAIMMKLARRFKMAAATGEYFANHEWQFDVSELTALHNEANSASDSSAFAHWPGQFNWDSYIGSYMLGIRRFILKDATESLPQARNKLKRLYWVHRLFQVATGYYVFKFLAGRLR
ncbi:putative fatty acyl-CoA reductase CG5065 [Maniola jurtina]|uniref:putative fatty acyl-CoA reductase CG5065 n=1 Tax=Maniola jurtina TaxID=191418 RepID=UPI001E68D39E|nr:putative fatty acyl-CoA reductase CG5065 [Maniola jurtina]